MVENAIKEPGDQVAPETMGLIRGFLFGAFLSVNTLVLGLLLFPAAALHTSIAKACVKIWARACLAGLYLICGIRHRIEGAENIPSGPSIVASNHQSMWETISLYALLPHPVIVFKRELVKIPIYGWWGVASGNIVVDRDGGATSLRHLTREAKRRLAEGAQIIIFPEGTRTPSGDRQPFQPGVAGIYRTSGVPCVPVAHDSGRFWPHPGIVKRPGVITLRFLPAIAPGLDREAFLLRLEDAIDLARPDRGGACSTSPR